MLTLSQWLLPAEADLADRIKHALADQRISVEGGGIGSLAAFGWRLLPGALAKHLAALLDIGLSDILIGAWNKSFTVRQQVEKSVKTPGKDLFVPLAEHKVTSTHSPYIALVKDGHEVARLPFAVSVEFTLQGTILRIIDGAIREIQTGKIKGKGSVKCGGLLLVQKELEPIAMPGTLPVAAAQPAGASQAV